MNILEVYKKYQIMPQLQEHMLKVAGVASIICENFQGDLDRSYVISACLLHDMGNIIKFDLNQTQNLLNSRLDLEYWKNVQQEFRTKYGINEHRAHLVIARELGVSEKILDLIDCISFLKAPNNAASKDFGIKITQYSDDRVGPHGVVALTERLSDLRKRYKRHGEESSERDWFEKALKEIEQQIFEHCKIKPEEITEDAVKRKFKMLINITI